MTIYLYIIRFNFLRFLAYPIEIWAAVIKRVINTGFLIIFWSIIANSSHGSISLAPLVSYFLLSSAVDDLVSAKTLYFGRYLGKAIKMGTINTYLIRPLSIIPYLYSLNLGEQSLSMILSVITFILGVAINPPSNGLSVILFLVFLTLAAAISLAFNLMIGILFFYSPEAASFRYTAGHIIKVFSGAIIPLTFFPNAIKQIVLLSPFPGMVFAPVTALHYATFNAEVAKNLAVNLIWAVLLLTVALLWWKKAIKNYDAIGM